MDDGLLDVLAEMQRKGKLYPCPACGDYFDAPVWHCRVCDHHWLGDRECRNCYRGKRRGSVVAALVPSRSGR